MEEIQEGDYISLMRLVMPPKEYEEWLKAEMERLKKMQLPALVKLLITCSLSLFAFILVFSQFGS